MFYIVQDHLYDLFIIYWCRMDLNKVTLIGRTTASIERQTIGTTWWSVCNFSLATNRSYKNSEDQLIKEAEFHKCVAFWKTAELLAEFCEWSVRLYLEWRLTTKQWKDKDENNKSQTEIIIDHFIFLDKKKQFLHTWDTAHNQETV